MRLYTLNIVAGDMTTSPSPHPGKDPHDPNQTCPTHLVPKGVVGSLLCAGLLDLLPAHHLQRPGSAPRQSASGPPGGALGPADRKCTMTGVQIDQP